MSLSLNIIARTNGVGLDRDVDLIHQVATRAGYRVAVSHCRAVSPLRRWFPLRKQFDANIFLERVFPRWLGAAQNNILIPNQERFPSRHISLLKNVDDIFCKSQHALEIFQKIHLSCHYTGFTSLDLFDAEVPRLDLGVLHLAGRSTLKGTETILQLWQAHPEWPPLTLVQCKENAPLSVPKNVKLITNYLSDEEIKRLYNEHPFHLCPSRSEGWGHYIVEAMSCRALVLTTDAPPMNEIVRPDRGILVRPIHSEKRHLGTNYFVDLETLEVTLQDLFATPLNKLAPIGNSARTWTLENHAAFERRFLDCLETILKA